VNWRPASGFSLSIAAVIAIIGFIVSWHFLGHMNPYGSLMPDSQTIGRVPIELTGVEIRTRHSGHPEWRVSAKSLTVAPDRESVSASDLYDGIFYHSGRPALFFNADHAQYEVPQFFGPSGLTIGGGINVLWKKANGSPQMTVHVYTPGVSWNSVESIAKFVDPVIFAANGLGSGSATGLSINTKLKRVSFETLTLITNLAVMDSEASAEPVGTTSSAAATPRSSNDNQVTYKASDGYWDETNRILTIKGPVTFHQGTADVTMIGATYDQKTNIAVSSSPIKITDTDATVNGDRGTIDFSAHTAALSGHVTMLVIPKATDKVKEQEAKKPTTISCDRINYNYRTKKAQTSGRVVIRQPNRTVTADDGLYDVTANIADLVGDVVGKSTDGKVIRAPHAKVSMDPDNEWIQLDGPISGSFTLSDQDNPGASTSKPAGKSTDAKQPAGNAPTPTPTSPDSTQPTAMPK
jgi:lipopolysaccharide export system protein LptA